LPEENSVTTTDAPPVLALARYHLLGRGGLRVSPLALGTMTFGQQGWGTDEETARAIFRRYLDAGGNFVDTANIYAQGRSEEQLGKFIQETGSRERLVLATKFSGPTGPGDPNAFGNGRKNILAALEASLRRLQTDYVDLYWLHMWDTVTPVEEVMSTFDALVRSGKVRAVGLSDVPAWYAAKAQMLAAARGWEPVGALQLEYSLVEREIEREHIPAALDLGLGVIPWAPLAAGFLSGKYTRDDEGPAGAGRLAQPPYNLPQMRRFRRQLGDREWALLDAVRGIAADLGRSPAQVAINWVARQPGVVSTLIGANSLRHLEDNLAALDFDLSAEQLAQLDQLSRPQLYQPYTIFDPELRRLVLGGQFEVLGSPRWYGA
jgi:aryl-alcohol dehydrogenase-like predicted oxidoreductase